MKNSRRGFFKPFLLFNWRKPSRFVSFPNCTLSKELFQLSTGKKEGSGRRTGNETDVQTRRSVSCILPCRSPLNYTDEAFYWRLKRELIKLATIFCRIEKKERRELPVFFDERLVKIAAHSSEIMLVFSRRRGKFFLEKEGRRFVEFLWQRNRWKSSGYPHACWSHACKPKPNFFVHPFLSLLRY